MSGAHAAGRAIEDVRFVKQNGVARAEIVFACPVRYLSHTPESGADLQVRIALEPECLAELGSGVRSELFDPPAGNLAGVKQVVFDTTVEDRVARVAIDVGRIVRFEVSQGPMRNVLRVVLDQTETAVQQGERVPDSAPNPPPRAHRHPRRARPPRPDRHPCSRPHLRWHRARSRRRLPRRSAGRCDSCSPPSRAPNASSFSSRRAKTRPARPALRRSPRRKRSCT